MSNRELNIVGKLIVSTLLIVLVAIVIPCYSRYLELEGEDKYLDINSYLDPTYENSLTDEYLINSNDTLDENNYYDSSEQQIFYPYERRPEQLWKPRRFGIRLPRPPRPFPGPRPGPRPGPNPGPKTGGSGKGPKPPKPPKPPNTRPPNTRPPKTKPPKTKPPTTKPSTEPRTTRTTNPTTKRTRRTTTETRETHDFTTTRSTTETGEEEGKEITFAIPELNPDSTLTISTDTSDPYPYPSTENPDDYMGDNPTDSDTIDRAFDETYNNNYYYY